MLAPFFRQALIAAQANWRFAVKTGKELGIPTPAFSASLDYYDSYRTALLPANLLQAQRDFFGAHTYERLDKPGVFHYDWY
jgi:6-phosphogluconate dehydrogenase